MSGPRVLVTGAAGFVGLNVIDVLRQRGDVDVIAGARATPPQEESPGVNWVQLDITDPKILASVFERYRPTHILNLAAYGVDPAEQDEGAAYRVNLRAPLDLLDHSASGVRRFMQVGSCAEYGARSGPIAETMPLAPRGPYAVTKSAASLLGLERARALGVDFVVLRPFGVWGPYEPQHRLVPAIRAGLAANARIKLTTGLQVRDFSYAPELAGIMVALLLKEETLPFDVINVGTGIGRSVRDFVSLVAQSLGAEALLEFGTEPMRTHEVPSVVADTARLQQTGVDLPETDVARQVEHLLRCGGFKSWA